MYITHENIPLLYTFKEKRKPAFKTCETEILANLRRIFVVIWLHFSATKVRISGGCNLRAAAGVSYERSGPPTKMHTKGSCLGPLLSGKTSLKSPPLTAFPPTRTFLGGAIP